MPALIQFVDSIGSSPTVRLDINDGAAWFCGDFSAPPPRLRRSESSNAMRDGGIVGSSSYENRTLSLSLTLVNTSTEDAAATELQKLWRELDRPVNWLRYQREGMTKPVFFRLFRSDVAELEELWTTPVARSIDLELLAEPFALGLRETLGPYTVNNDPAATSNGLFFDVTGVVGDVATEPMFWWSTDSGTFWLGASHGSTAIVAPMAQAETASLLGDTANPGGGPDASMSGTGTNNFARTSFATGSYMANRLQFNGLLPPGAWRALVAVRRSSATGVINVKADVYGTPVATSLTTSRQIVDLGIVYGRESTPAGAVGVVNSVDSTVLRVAAERVSGTSTLDWDYIYLIPAGNQVNEISAPQLMIAQPSLSVSPLVDSAGGHVSYWFGGDPSIGTSSIRLGKVTVAGGFPSLSPAIVNRFYVVHQSATTHAKSTVLTIYGAYWPRYLYVRPVSS